MKHHIIFSLVLFVLTGFASCSDMNSLHDEYLENGEVNYIGRVDSVTVFPGYERVKLRYWIQDPRVKTLTVYWSQKSDSIVIDVPPHKASEYMEKIIGRNEKTLSEGDYTFQFMSRDHRGNRSILYEMPVSVYGERFGSQFKNRSVSSVVGSGTTKSLTVKWGSSSTDKEVGVELLFKSFATGKDSVLYYPTADLKQKTVTTDVNLRQGVNYRTLFVPHPLAIDTFRIENRILMDPSQAELDNTLFKAMAKSVKFKNAGGTPANMGIMWDDITTPTALAQTYYLNGGNSENPYFTVDLGVNSRLSRFMLWDRSADNQIFKMHSMRTFELWAWTNPDVTNVDDPENWDGWEKVSDYEASRPSGSTSGNPTASDVAFYREGYGFNVPAFSTPIRYIRLRSTLSWGGAKDGTQGMWCSEIKFFGKILDN